MVDSSCPCPCTSHCDVVTPGILGMRCLPHGWLCQCLAPPGVLSCCVCVVGRMRCGGNSQMNRNEDRYWVGLMMGGLVLEGNWYEILRRRSWLIECKKKRKKKNKQAELLKQLSALSEWSSGEEPMYVCMLNCFSLLFFFPFFFARFLNPSFGIGFGNRELGIGGRESVMKAQE